MNLVNKAAKNKLNRIISLRLLKKASSKELFLLNLGKNNDKKFFEKNIHEDFYAGAHQQKIVKILFRIGKIKEAINAAGALYEYGHFYFLCLSGKKNNKKTCDDLKPILICKKGYNCYFFYKNLYWKVSFLAFFVFHILEKYISHKKTFSSYLEKKSIGKHSLLEIYK